VNTLRAGLREKHKVTLSSTSKGKTKDKMCERTETPTAFSGERMMRLSAFSKKAKKTMERLRIPHAH
jgi:hypothetical protein